VLVFGSTPGVVGAIVTGATLPFSIAVGGNNGVAAFPSYVLIKSILTGFRFAGQSGLGISHSLRDRIYLYVSGERISQVEVTGIGFAGTCNSSSAQNGNWTGFDGLHAYYERVRASSQGLRCRLVLGPQTSLDGFLSEFQFGLDDPQTAIGSFSFKFLAVPRIYRFGEQRTLPWE